jgi:mRNA-degrading endonuclease RelE of RelBE toxin-antitoxin system
MWKVKYTKKFLKELSKIAEDIQRKVECLNCRRFK